MKAEPTRKLARRRIMPAAVRSALHDPQAPRMADELTAHPLVVRALDEAQRLLNTAEETVERAKRQGVQKIAEAYAAAVRDLHNQRRRTVAPAPSPSPQRWPA